MERASFFIYFSQGDHNIMCKFIGPNPFSCYFTIIFHPKYIMYTPFDYANVLILTL
jgi:hypothetical protein